jgi:hypothetical protein
LAGSKREKIMEFSNFADFFDDFPESIRSARDGATIPYLLSLFLLYDAVLQQ